jgi:hypothetical protein
MGNAVLRGGEDAETFDRARGSAVHDVAGYFQSQRYPAAESDIVALMVLEHQARMHNLITRLRFDAEHARAIDADVDGLLRYMLFVDEAPLGGAITAATTFRTDFERLGPLDPRGRSLRQFDLRTRMFRYPCSYLIYSDAFLALPAPVKARIYERLGGILEGRTAEGPFARLAASDRQAILEILQATHPDFAASRRPA